MEICFLYHDYFDQYEYQYYHYEYQYYHNQHEYNNYEYINDYFNEYQYNDEYEYNDNLIAMKILLNAKNGAPIRDVWFKYNKYFTEPFLPGKIIKVDDSLADFVLETFGFVEEISSVEAKRLMDKAQDKFKCDFKTCDFSTNTEVALSGHKRSHEKEADVDVDGIPTIKIVTVETVGEEKKHDPFAAGEAEDKAAGLEGEGLVNEAPRRAVIMR